jgi:ATP-dependent DNA helicase RecG
MRAQEVVNAVRSGESFRVELKSSLADSRRIIETVAAMATSGGGMVLVGVRPDGQFVGIEVGENTLERFLQRVHSGTDPRIYVDLRVVDVQGVQVLVVQVPPGDGLHFAFGRAFHRPGPATVQLTRHEIERRLLDGLRESGGFERRTDLGLTICDTNPAAIAGRFDGDAVLERLNVVRDEALNVAGILLFATHPQRPLPQAVIRARSQRGASEDTAAIEGSVFDQIDTATAFAVRNLKIRADRTRVVRRDVPELPEGAIREVISNAVAHRDYRSTAAIQLRLDDRALVVWNPGHLPDPITTTKLREPHPSVPTNPLLANGLFRAGYIEEWGDGTLRVIREMAANGNPDPLFEEVDAGIRVTLPLPGAIVPGLNERQLAFIQSLASGATTSTGDYAGSAGVSRATALHDLRGLERRGLVSRVGVGRATKWRRG